MAQSGQDDIRVLLAEDEFLVGEMIRRLLKDNGYVIVGSAGNGWEAVEMTQALRPDVVLMDIQMPDMDGITATQRIFQYCPTPVVMLTAHSSPEFVSQASRAGAGAFLIKPSNAPELARAISIAMARFEDMVALRALNTELSARNVELEQALATVKQLTGLLPICAACKKIRDDQGYWHDVERYIREHSEASFSHGICPDCAKELYPGRRVYND